MNETVIEYAIKVLKPGGTLLIKTSRGGQEMEVKKSLEALFEQVQVILSGFNVLTLGSL
jgi:23S rRNA U2552 (ribose-2'-O)-methylase RlmE/FtsJ